MRRLFVFLFVIALAVPVVADQAVDEAKALEMQAMGITVDREPVGVTDAPVVDTYNGSLTASSPIYDRVYGSAVDPACNATMLDSSVNGQYYEAIPIQVSAVENLAAEVISFTGGDTVITVYCDPFDPLNPLANVVAYNDDGGAGTLSAFVDGDGVTLQPGSTYWFVFSTFSGGVTGDFSIDFTSATVSVVPVELQSLSVE